MFTISTGYQLEKKEKAPEGVNLQNDDMLQRSFFYILLGPPSSGKSTLIEWLIGQPEFYAKKFNSILFITPSSFDSVDLVLEENWYPTLKLSWIEKKIDELNNREGSNTKQMLIILDDCVSDLAKEQNNPTLSSLFYNRRHLRPKVHISIIVTSQYWTKIPSSIRAMHTGLFIFKIPKIEWQKLKNELVLESIKQLDKGLLNILKAPHSFIFINCLNENVFYKLEKKLII